MGFRSLTTADPDCWPVGSFSATSIFHDLPAAGEQSLKMLGSADLVGRNGGLIAAAKWAKHPGVDADRSWQLPRGFGKVPHLTRIDDRLPAGWRLKV